jgi:MFS family permease
MNFLHVMLTPRVILLGLAVGAATGAMIALLADRLTHRQQPGLFKAMLIDAILGAIGFAGGSLFFANLPIMEKTTTTHVAGMIVRTTTRNYQDPFRYAFSTAIFPAVVYEMFRSRRWRRAQKLSQKLSPPPSKPHVRRFRG